MGKTVAELLSQSLSDFVSGDTASTKIIVTKDKKVDLFNKEVRSHLISAIKRNPNSIESNLNLILFLNV